MLIAYSVTNKAVREICLLLPISHLCPSSFVPCSKPSMLTPPIPSDVAEKAPNLTTHLTSSMALHFIPLRQTYHALPTESHTKPRFPQVPQGRPKRSCIPRRLELVFPRRPVLSSPLLSCLSPAVDSSPSTTPSSHISSSAAAD